MKKPILQNGRLLPNLEEALQAEYDVHPLWREEDPHAFLARHGGDFVALVTSAPIGADANLIRNMPSLKVITSFGVGLDKIDLEAAKVRGIKVSNTPNVLNNCVADLALGLIVDVARGISAADRFVRNGSWLKGKYPLMTSVTGKKLGIVGLGRIGQAAASRAAGFEMNIRYHNTRPIATAPYVYMDSVAALAEWADFLLVTVSGGDGTRHLISEEILAALGPTGYLVNVSRGSVVDERALINALLQKKIAGAGLDVFASEPHVPAMLFDLDNVVLLPHIASGTHETRKAMSDLVLKNIRQYFLDGELATPVA